MLHHLVSWPREDGPVPHPCIVLLHGRGADEQDLFGLIPALPKRPVIVSPRAPNAFPMGGHYWYEPIARGMGPDPATIEPSLEQVHELLTALPDQYQVDPKQVFLLGFSQGALMSGYMTARNPELIAGTVMLSGYLPGIDSAPGLAGKPFFVAHGTSDGMLPVVLGRQARVALEGFQADLEYHEYPMDHQIINAELEDLARWFEKQGLS